MIQTSWIIHSSSSNQLINELWYFFLIFSSFGTWTKFHNFVVESSFKLCWCWFGSLLVLLRSISQLYDKGSFNTFDPLSYLIVHKYDKERLLKGSGTDNVLNLNDVWNSRTNLLVTLSEDSWLWHRHFDHDHFDWINMLVSKDIIIGLPNFFLKISYVMHVKWKRKQGVKV